MTRRTSFTVALLLAATPAFADPPCKPIHFPHGQSQATITGMAPADDLACYSFGAGAGQTAEVHIKGRNVIFVIPDVTDMEIDKTFTTKKRTYKLQVGQMERANGPEPFSMTLAIR